MGHSATMSEKYREIPPANLEAIYAQVEPFLTVYAEDNTAELAETKRKSEKALDLVLDLREENKRLTAMLESLAERLGRLDGLRERIENLEEIGALPVEKEALRKAELTSPEG